MWRIFIYAYSHIFQAGIFLSLQLKKDTCKKQISFYESHKHYRYYNLKNSIAAAILSLTARISSVDACVSVHALDTVWHWAATSSAVAPNSSEIAPNSVVAFVSSDLIVSSLPAIDLIVSISLIEDYYNHFDEEGRLDTRHGQVEFVTAVKYIEKELDNDKSNVYCHSLIFDFENLNEYKD